MVDSDQVGDGNDIQGEEYLDGSPVILEGKASFPGSSRPVTQHNNSNSNNNDDDGEQQYDSIDATSHPPPNNILSKYNNNNNSNSDNYGNLELWPEYCDPSYQMPSEIEVRVSLANGDYYFPVTVIKSSTNKQYFGGYRNKLTGSLYHHANTQTPISEQKRNKSIKDYSHLRSRDTQTHNYRTLSIQPYRESGTQMERIDLRLDTKYDVIKTPRPYFTSEQLAKLKLANTIFIQRMWRGYMARCLSRRLIQRKIEYEHKKQQEIEHQIREDRMKRDADMHRRLHPKSNSDFATLYSELDNWRKNEIIKVRATIPSGEERTKALAAILDDETKALQSIQKLRINAQKSFHSEKTEQMLTLMSQPYKWQLSSGDVAHVQTAATTRSKELLDLYLALQAPLSNTDERLDVLLHIKWCVNEFDSSLTRDISDLIDREADLLNRGRPVKSMEKLRVRLINMFLQFIENPEYNPRVGEFIIMKK